MARKSRQRRLTETTALYEGYTAAGLAESYHGRFIRDMKFRLERGKGLYPKQRTWLDDLIEGGVPAPKGDPAAIAKIDAAVAGWAGNVERSWESGVLSDFRHKFVNGWDLSEKQAALLEKMLKRYDDDVTGVNVYTPSDDEHSDLEVLCRLYNGYAAQWRNERPAVAKAVDRVRRYLAGEEHATIEEYHVSKLTKAMGAKLRRVKTQRFNAGDLGWISEGWGDTRVVHLVTAITDTYVTENGIISNDWLIPSGSVETFSEEKVSKRRIKV